MIRHRSTQATTLLLTVTTVAMLATPALAAAPTQADRQAFLNLQQAYVQMEITETGTKEFDPIAAKGSITAGAYKINRSVRLEVPFNMAMPGTPPPSSMPLGMNEMMEQERFIGWMVMPPEDSGVEQQIATGKIVLEGNPMFLPGDFAIDQTFLFKYRDSPQDAFATNTTVSRGKGAIYIAKSGMLMCDLKKMTCDLAGIDLSYQSLENSVTVDSTSDVPGFEAKRETQAPSVLLPRIPPEVAKKLNGFPLTLPTPCTVSFSGPGVAPNGQPTGTTIAVKLTVASAPAPKPAARPAPKAATKKP